MKDQKIFERSKNLAGAIAVRYFDAFPVERAEIESMGSKVRKLLLCLQMYFLIMGVLLWNIYLVFQSYSLEWKFDLFWGSIISLYCLISFFLFVRSFQFLKRGCTSNLTNLGSVCLSSIVLIVSVYNVGFLFGPYIEAGKTFETLKYSPTELFFSFPALILAWIGAAFLCSTVILIGDWKTNLWNAAE